MNSIALGILCAIAFLAFVLPLRSWLRRYGPVDEALWRWAYWSVYHHSRAWKRARLARKIRDGNECVSCGATERLEVHHLCYHGWAWYLLATALRLREPLENLVTFCEGCHYDAHFHLPRIDNRRDS